jgi:hypothetical protein
MTDMTDFLARKLNETPKPRGPVYVVIEQAASGAITHLEVLDTAPRWDLEPGQSIYVANVNGGDSARTWV